MTAEETMLARKVKAEREVDPFAPVVVRIRRGHWRNNTGIVATNVPFMRIG